MTILRRLLAAVGSRSLPGGDSAVCPRCASTEYCIKPPGHGGPHECANGHTWY